MAFDYHSWILNPFILIFASTLLGLLFGSISLGKFKFGVSGTLFSGLIIGKYTYEFALGLSKTDSAYTDGQSMISSGVVSKDFFLLFLILFVASVGLLAAKDMGIVLKKYGMKFIAIGIIVTFTGAFLTFGLMALGNVGDTYEMTGLYTGALTSSPGFAAAIEMAGDNATREAENYITMDDEDKKNILNRLDSSGNLTPQNTQELSREQKIRLAEMAESGVGVGNAIAYPFGVLVVILAMNFIPVIFKIDMDEEKRIYIDEMHKMKKDESERQIKSKIFDLPAFALVCFAGYSLGKVGISLGEFGVFTLGSTGGVLIGALILGHIGKIGPFNFRMDSVVLGVFRQFSLAFFLSIVGLRNGYAVYAALGESGIALALAALFVGSLSMLGGYLTGRYVFKINWIMLSGAICGGMTSTPGLGAAIDATKSNDPAAGYGATYPFALVGMVIFTLVLNTFTF